MKQETEKRDLHLQTGIKRNKKNTWLKILSIRLSKEYIAYLHDTLILLSFNI